ncbi:hypothetical protein C7S18_20340 [Ahniella affigens]|uniref:Uncharacterized protein n=2 Tax=Ahniella affigens TaxID=2021234 RepID=A0A2P1PX11_9GAMM|nr:hypothetical protein C7S18_20340 [Ahniella affigens]
MFGPSSMQCLELANDRPDNCPSPVVPPYTWDFGIDESDPGGGLDLLRDYLDNEADPNFADSVRSAMMHHTMMLTSGNDQGSAHTYLIDTVAWACMGELRQDIDSGQLTSFSDAFDSCLGAFQRLHYENGQMGAPIETRLLGFLTNNYVSAVVDRIAPRANELIQLFAGLFLTGPTDSLSDKEAAVVAQRDCAVFQMKNQAYGCGL